MFHAVSTLLALPIDDIVAQFLELSVVEVVNVVELLQTDDVSLAVKQLLNDSWATELEV